MTARQGCRENGIKMIDFFDEEITKFIGLQEIEVKPWVPCILDEKRFLRKMKHRIVIKL